MKIRFIAENYGPIIKADIELGDYLTLFVGMNNTGKSFISRAIYAILKSCSYRDEKLSKKMLINLLLNNIYSKEDDLIYITKDFKGKLNILLQINDKRLAKIYYDIKAGKSNIDIKKNDEFLVWYVPSDRNARSIFYPFIESKPETFRLETLIKIVEDFNKISIFNYLNYKTLSKFFTYLNPIVIENISAEVNVEKEGIFKFLLPEQSE